MCHVQAGPKRLNDDVPGKSRGQDPRRKKVGG